MRRISDTKKRQFNAAILLIRENVKRADREAKRRRRDAIKRLVVLRLDDFPATIVAIGADVVAQMHFARARLDGQWRCIEEIVRAMHAALGCRFFVLLDCHDNS
jgi:hypothetical protein